MAGNSSGDFNATVAGKMASAVQTAAAKSDQLKSNLGAAATAMSTLSTVSKGLGKVWGAMLGNSEKLRGQVRRINSKFSELAGVLGDSLAPGFKIVADLVAEGVSVFKSLPGPVKDAVAAGFAMVSVLVTLGSIVAAAQASVLALGFAFGSLLTPIVAVLAVVALLYVAWKNNLFGIKDIATNVFAAVKNAVTGFVNFVRPFVKKFLSVIRGAWQAALSGVRNVTKRVFTAIKEAVMTFVNFVRPFVKKFLSAVFEGRWLDALNVLLSFHKTVFRKLLKAFVKLAVMLGAQVAKLGARVVVGLETAWKQATNGAKKFLNGLVSFFEGGINKVIGFFNGLIQAVENTVNGIIKALNKLPKFNLEQVNLGKLDTVSMDDPFETKSAAEIRREGREKLRERTAEIEERSKKRMESMMSSLEGVLGSGAKGDESGPGSPSPSKSGGGQQVNNVTIERMNVRSESAAPSTRQDSRRLSEDISRQFASDLDKVR